MNKNQEINNRIIDILFKKAEGFKYFEEQYEYEKNKESKVKPIYENLTFFQNDDRGDGSLKKDDVKIKVANEEDKFKESEGLILVKKKITSHYIPPDMLAVKILLEIFGKEAINDDLNKLTDEELINFKNKILKELKDEIDN